MAKILISVTLLFFCCVYFETWCVKRKACHAAALALFLKNDAAKNKISALICHTYVRDLSDCQTPLLSSAVILLLGNPAHIGHVVGHAQLCDLI